jgi:hypothetical protein
VSRLVQHSGVCLHVEKVIDKNRKSNAHVHDPAWGGGGVNINGSMVKWLQEELY